MTIIEKIENFLNDWKNENSSVENSYNNYKYIPINDNEDEEVSFDQELEKILNSSTDITNYEMTYVGGFDSCGYSISCNVLTFLYEGKIHIYPINYESL